MRGSASRSGTPLVRHGGCEHDRQVAWQLGLTRLQPRPVHPKKDAQAEATFKNFASLVCDELGRTDIMNACKTAWNWLIADPERIQSIGTRDWAVGWSHGRLV